MFQLKLTYNSYLVRLPDQITTDQIKTLMSIVQMALRHWQAWGTDHLSRKSSMFNHLLVKKKKKNSYQCPL